MIKRIVQLAPLIAVFAGLLLSAPRAVAVGDLDGDGFSDDREAGTPLCDGARNQDLFDDAVVDDGCPGIDQVGAFSEAAFNIGTSNTRRCGDVVSGRSTAWPSDLSVSGLSLDKITLTDLSAFTSPTNRLNTSPNDANYDKRWDLQPGNTSDGVKWIGITDMAQVSNHFPPMAPFYGTKSFGGLPCIRHDFQPAVPAQGSFFYSWFPNTWAKSSIGKPCTVQTPPHNCYTPYTPTLGFYDATNTAIIDQQLALTKKAHQDFMIGSWFGPGGNEDAQLSAVMSRAEEPTSPHLSLRFAAYYEDEGTLNPDLSTLTTDLAYIETHFFLRENYLRVGTAPVLFVYGGDEGCEMAQRWADAKAAFGDIYLVLKIFQGYAGCASQPDAWHQYGPAQPVHDVGTDSYNISPGYHQLDNPSGSNPPPFLARDPVRFEKDAGAMVASGNTWQLVTSWNEWGEGTAIEPALEYGETYINILCRKIPASVWMTTPCNDPQIVAVGDIACNSLVDLGDRCRQQAVADLVTGHGYYSALPLGDTQYENGELANFNAYYDASFGAFKNYSYPAFGNHEHNDTTVPKGYFSYFNNDKYTPIGGSENVYPIDRTGTAGNGALRSYDVGNWHLISFSTMCNYVGGCNIGGAGYNWLSADLDAQPAGKCILLYSHHPVISAGEHDNTPNDPPTSSNGDRMHRAIYRLAYDKGVDLMLAGHDHNVQMYPRLNREANAADSAGIRSMVIGTGGKNFTPQNNGDPIPLSLRGDWMDEVGSNLGSDSSLTESYGVMKLTLKAGGYDWAFAPVPGKAWTTSGTDTCR